ncbi:carbohydrate ABC transporter permease [Nonomuraea guangzhouensis]|uniref:Carbohydrate ABC transporter permease n=1 Tax=Nonomuraea guangzhouensis TaxID=1291555 RepID=A0ABW4GUC8_9ACTN|nr:carbohydrate ABC transporter permease [Nonomuraea guangzhouensis]
MTNAITGQGPSTRRRRRRGAEHNPLVWCAVAIVMVFSLVPLYWLINTSLKTGPDLSTASLTPPRPTLDNYLAVLGDSRFLGALVNSIIVATTTTILALTVASFAAYPLARLTMRGKFLILSIVLSVTTFPGIAIAAPMFALWNDLGLYNTLVGLIIPYLTFTLPLSIYTLVSFFKEIPVELEEAAYIDGTSPFLAYYKVILPLAAPSIATVGILAFIFAWNEFLLAATLTYSPTARTVPVAIAFFTGASEYEQPLGTISAASVIISIPLVLLVLVFQKKIVSGLTAGAVKG